MTSDEFASKYDVHQQIAEGPVRSHFAHSRSAKVPALVHYLEGGETRENAGRLAQVKALADSPRHVLLDVCDVEGTPVVVTRFILNFTTFDAWLATESAAPPPRSAPKPATPAAPQSPPRTPATPPDAPKKAAGEFTHPFGAAVHREPPPTPTPGPGPARTAPRRGSFSRLFGKVVVPEAGPPPPAPLPETPTSGPFTSPERFLDAEPQEGADVLYRRLHSPPEPPSPPTPPSPPPSPPRAPPGEFTQVFGASATTPAAPARPPSAGLRPPAAPEASPPEPRAAPSPQGGADYIARLQGARPAAPPATPPAPSTKPARTIASEFTRALRRISASIVESAEPEALPAETSPGPRPSPLPWVIAILGVLAVVAVGVVLYFALTSK